MKMPFGKFKGYDLGELPDDYLEWLRFEIDLREPLKSAIRRECLKRERGERVQREETAITTMDATQIKKIYWKLARTYHPDRIGGDGGIMTGINLFYEEIKQI